MFVLRSAPKDGDDGDQHGNLESVTCLDLTCQTGLNNEEDAQRTNTYFLSV